MTENSKPKSAIEFMLAWMEEPEHKRRIEANDPTIYREYDLALHRFMRDHPKPAASPKPPRAEPAPASRPGRSKLEEEMQEIGNAERVMGWLSWPEWKEEGEGRLETLHPVVRDSLIQQYEFWIADIVDGAIDPVARFGMEREAAIEHLRREAAPFVAAQEEFRRNPPKMPPLVEAHYRKLFPWFFAEPSA